MLSKKAILDALDRTANNLNLTGEAVQLIKNELTYSLYHEQLEITNAIQESNLSTAYLINSKIRSCMDNMYSVYRGKNVRVGLKLAPEIEVNFSKFDVIFASNTFKVYAEDVIALNSGVEYTLDYDSEENGYKELVGILSTRDLYESEIQITERKFYVDFKIDNEILSNLSEYIQVSINEGTGNNMDSEEPWVEYPVTRNFFDFIQEPLYGENDYDEEGNRLRNSIFLLTLPDFGVRLYKRGYFQPKVNTDNNSGYFNSALSVRIRGLRYTTAEEINPDEFNKIIVPGVPFVQFDKSDTKSYYKLDYETGVGLIPEIKREDNNSLLYTANFYSRLQNKILSRSDINHLFNEIFIEKVQSSKNWYDGMNVYVGEDGETRPASTEGNEFKDGNIWIFYVPKNRNRLVGNKEFNSKYVQRYKSYFISPFIKCSAGIPIDIEVNIVLYLNANTDITTKLEDIYNEYANILNIPSQWDFYGNLNSNNPNNQELDIIEDNVFKPSRIRSEISKVSEISYVESIDYVWKYTLNGKTIEKHFIECNETNTDVTKSIPESVLKKMTKEELQELQENQIKHIRESYPPLYVWDDDKEINVPTYLSFNLNLLYKSSYNLINNHG